VKISSVATAAAPQYKSASAEVRHLLDRSWCMYLGDQ